MSENISFDYMPFFLKSDRKDNEKSFVNTQEVEHDILKQPEFLDDLRKTLNSKKRDPEAEKEAALLDQQKIANSFMNIAQKPVINKQDDSKVIDDLYNQIKQ